MNILRNIVSRAPFRRAGLIVALVVLVTGVTGYTIYDRTMRVGRQSDGSVVLPTNQTITPAGRQVEFPGRPNAVSLRPDGKTAAVLNSAGDDLVVVDMASGAIKQRFAQPGDSSFAGLLYSPDGKKLYASQAGGTLLIASVAPEGSLSLDARVALPQRSGNPYPGGVALSEDGATLYVALSRNNTLGVFDLATRKLVAEIPVGNAPHSVVLSGGKAYVSNRGGRPAREGDFTNNSSGTEIVADPESGAAITGTVSVVDLATRLEIKSVEVGLHPTGMHLEGKDLFVANTNSDTLSVVDTERDVVAKTIEVAVFPGAPYGSSPNALTMIPGEDPEEPEERRLVVSLGRNNALALYRWEGAAEVVRFEGLVPTGGYPASVAVDATAKQLIVANNTGASTAGAPRVSQNTASASIIPFPTGDQMEGYTAQVNNNNDWTRIEASVRKPDSKPKPPQPVPVKIGDPSTIKHVFYIIKENRTYDQFLGDEPRGEGDPSLAMFGGQVTPNHHKLAREFPLLDNTYVSGRLSADGHQWATQAYVTDYLEKAFGGFVRSYPFNGGDSLAYSPAGFLWENATQHGTSVRAYGEYANEFRGPSARFGRWADWYRDYQILRGEASGELHVEPGEFETHSDVPSLDRLLHRPYPPYTNAIPDVYRSEVFLKEFKEYERNGNLPSLVMMQLNTDHTSGTAANFPTPRAQVADNDLALGRVVEAISKSRYWKDSAIFVIEDDTQTGLDHVDGHRTPAYVISPWVKRGVVDSTYYTQIDMVRTIEQILGLRPMNQMDLAATPMRSLFTKTPNNTPYTAAPNEIPLDEMNPGSVPPGEGPPVEASQCSTAAPLAGASTTLPPFTRSSTRPDVVEGDTYHFVKNGCVQANVVSRVAGNNAPGTFQPGWIGDVALLDGPKIETLDWSEMILARGMNDPARPWGRDGDWLSLPNISASGDSVTASGQAQLDPAFKASITYRVLPGSPVVKATLRLENTGATDFQGYFQYLLDPDSSQDVAKVPGIARDNPGFLTSGWTGNYVYDGPTTAIYSPAHGVAWRDDQPTGVTAFGYIFGAWWDASTPAGGTRTITWYHITDYPAAGGDVKTNIAGWAAKLDTLDPAGAVQTSAPDAGAATKPRLAGSSTETLQAEWVAASDAMEFGGSETRPDENDENVLNRAIWYGTKGYDTPYPGDGRVLRPHEVPPAEGHESEEEEEER